MEQKCLYCERTPEQIPLINLAYKEGNYWICPQHLPILIHKPAQLADKLPGADTFGSSEGHDHH
ncbi:hypothetical protein ACFLZW_01275 [Chloroflexota bacterium]